MYNFPPFLGFKLFDVRESFGRNMDDIRQKITEVRKVTQFPFLKFRKYVSKILL